MLLCCPFFVQRPFQGGNGLYWTGAKPLSLGSRAELSVLALGETRSGRCPWSCRLKAGMTPAVQDVGLRVGRQLSRRKTNLPALWEMVLTVYWEYVAVWFCPGIIIPHTGMFYMYGVTTSAFDRCAVPFCSSSLKGSSSHWQYNIAYGETRVF